MDYSSVVISLLVVSYGVYEYRRREKSHRATMELLTRGEVLPAAGSQPRSWNLLTTGSICALLAGFAGSLFYTGVHLRNNYARPLEIMGCLITLPLVILLMIFVRDLRRYAAAQRVEKEEER
jgi:high-affinity Fe2+/Pb2+ permease